MPGDFIKALVRALGNRRTAFYGVLTYNGLQKWSPHRPADNEIAAAFNRHQMTDKGMGPAAGPLAAALLADQLRLEGYNVLEGDSPWRLGQSDRTLIEEVQRGHALAVLELKAVDQRPSKPGSRSSARGPRSATPTSLPSRLKTFRKTGSLSPSDALRQHAFDDAILAHGLVIDRAEDVCRREPKQNEGRQFVPLEDLFRKLLVLDRHGRQRHAEDVQIVPNEIPR